MRLAFLASGRGSNMCAIIDACKVGKIKAEPILVVSNKHDAKALEHGKKFNLVSYYIDSKLTNRDEIICDLLLEHKIDLVVLAGYLLKIGQPIVDTFKNKIINIHPALLPKYGGKGMYGENVHGAVLAAKEKETGATIHLVNSEYDQGRILAQVRVPVLPHDNVESLAKRVLNEEHKLYVDTLKRIALNEIKLNE